SRTATTRSGARAPLTNRPGWTPAAGSSRSVARDRAVHVLGPGVDAALHVVDLAEAELAEVLGRLCAAVAVVAEEGERGVVRQRLERPRALVEGGVGHGHGGQRALLRRAHVHQAQLAGGGAGLGLGGRGDRKS